MANADTTKRLREQTLALEQQLQGERELPAGSRRWILTPSSTHGPSAPRGASRDGLTNRLAVELVDPGSGVARRP